MTCPVISPTPRKLAKRIAGATMRHSSQSENEDVATLTGTIETNLWQGDLETRVRSFSGDQESSELERQKSRAEELVTIHDIIDGRSRRDGEIFFAGNETSSKWEERCTSDVRTWSGASHCACCTALDLVELPKKLPPASHINVSLCCLTCRLSRVSCPRSCFLTTSPKLPDCDRQKRFFLASSIVAAAKHGPRCSDMHASFSGVSRDTAQGVQTRVQVSREFDPFGSDGDGRAVVRLRRHRRQHGWTCPQLSTFLLYGPRSPQRVYKLF